MASNFQQALASIPGLGGYLAAQQNDQSMLSGQIGNVAQVQQVMAGQEQMRQRMLANQREQEFRAGLQALGPNPSQEALAGLAAKFSSPDKLLQSQQSSLDRQAQIGATREATMARLQQQASQFEQTHQARLASAKTAEERNAEIARHNRVKEAFGEYAARIAGANAKYNTGVEVPFFPPTDTPQAVPQPQTQPAPQAVPMQSGPLSTVQGDFGGVGVNLQGVSPAALAAVRATPEAHGNPDLQAALGGAPAAPTPAPRPTPAHTPNLPAGAAPGVPVAAPAPAPAPAAPSGLPQMPPEIARLPKKVQDQWALDQAKKTGTEKAMPADAINKLRDNQQNLKRAERALDLVSGKGVGSQIPDANATGLKGLMPDFMLQRVDPQGVDARAAIADLGSLVIHQRSGAAVTAAEFPRLVPFIPKASDDPEVVKKKLRRFVEVYREEVQDTTDFFKASGYKVPDLNAQPPAAPAAPGSSYTDPEKERRYQEWKKSRGL